MDPLRVIAIPGTQVRVDGIARRARQASTNTHQETHHAQHVLRSRSLPLAVSTSQTASAIPGTQEQTEEIARRARSRRTSLSEARGRALNVPRSIQKPCML